MASSKISRPDSHNVTPSLNALLQSLSVGSNGATVDSGALASLLSAASRPTGAGASGESQQTLSVDMQSLANLMQYVNATKASQLLQNSGLLSQSAFSQSGGVPIGGAPVALPGISGFSGLSVPSVGTPSLSVGTPSAAIPSIPLTAFVIPLAAAAAVAAFYLSRGRIVRLIGSQSLPGMPLPRGVEGGERDGGRVQLPADPRKRIEFYFGKAVRLMGRRGVPKSESETHREFSSKCESTPEQAQVSTISSLYEKAKFSGQDVGTPEADLAASEFFAMEQRRAMKLRQFISILGVVALAAVIYSPSTIGLSATPAGDGGTGPTDTSSSGTSMFLSYLHQAGYHVTVANSTQEVMASLGGQQKVVYLLVGADNNADDSRSYGTFKSGYDAARFSALIAEGNTTNEGTFSRHIRSDDDGVPHSRPDLHLPGQAGVHRQHLWPRGGERHRRDRHRLPGPADLVVPRSRGLDLAFLHRHGKLDRRPEGRRRGRYLLVWLPGGRHH